jgi:hypothetical protein
MSLYIRLQHNKGWCFATNLSLQVVTQSSGFVFFDVFAYFGEEFLDLEMGVLAACIVLASA